ncbi:RICIN domain-containing protein [Streptomyces hydrogenans]|uniref:hypothetical protein n=1 Tax=Streptomyces hydrogenans TaxID=1873719 RepID=UPI0037F7E34A
MRAVNASNPLQNWRDVQNTSGTSTLTNPATGYVLDRAAINAGAAVTVGQPSPADSQGWTAIT